MEKGTGENPPETCPNSSPRSTLGWKDVWGSENTADLEPTKYKPLVRGSSHSRSKSLVGVASSGRLDGPKTPSLQSDKVVDSSPARCRSFVGLPSRGTPDRPRTPPPPLERRLIRSLSPPDASQEESGRLVVIPESSGWTDGPAANSLPVSGSVQVAANERGRGAQPSQLWEPVWLQDFPTNVFPPALSRASTSTRDDETMVSSASEDTWTVASSSSTAPTPSWTVASASSTAPTPRVQKGPLSNRMEFVSSLNEELLSIKSCMKRAIDLGKKVQRYGSLEVSQLRGEKANAEAAIRKAVLLNHDLEQQVNTLRDEVQKLHRERELEVLSRNKEIRELEMERSRMVKTVREEKSKREKLQSEVDSVLSVLLEEKMKLESEREAHDIALQNEKKKVRSMQKARDAAVKTLEEGNKKLDAERDAMLSAMRDLTSRMDMEREAKLRSMRRSSMDMATMISGLRTSSRRRSLGFNEEQSPASRPLSRRSSRLFEPSPISSPVSSLAFSS